ncbi:MAG: potassium transporter Kup [Magnetococcales bacterium]|nr:potassium transporter Kup [Magnetococcales bacterium]MBF0150668.1 potassium transporter Kup [Magnetococcales bacterium]MBF0173432.1 potassium transporter Kup [Magnetococcales bacterium]MBF0346336.1 potassium transporter Kup [Magnetococcales bacterium]MBF0631639.1 potassium transporter Kup [Magnetococcales bacterium]
MSHSTEHVQQSRLLPLMIGAIGVVFGDIGTSPLYAVKEALGGSHASVPTHDNVLGVISLIVWTLLIVLTVKYQFFIMRAGHQGEGGSLVLVELARKLTKDSPEIHRPIMIIGMIGVAFFFGDGVITPAISVLSAVEGLEVVTPTLKPYVVPVTLLVLFLLFFFQDKGTARIGRLFGPICTLWFLAIALIGLKEIYRHPEILMALNPFYGINYLFGGGHVGGTFLVLGSVFLAVTGAEALYADMGHFGKRAINWAWGVFVFPALILNYLGQGALILGDPLAVRNPFFISVPEWLLFPMVLLATAATVIASQAVISGAYSATRQAMQLGYLPRLRVIHTSSTEFGQIYVPVTNWMLLISVVILVIGFQSSNNLAAAYGIAVTITMIADTSLAFGIVLRKMFSWSWPKAIILMSVFLSVDLGFFGANILKVPDGGWFTLTLGAILFFLMSTWRKGQDLVRQAVRRQEIPLESFLRQFESENLGRMPGTAVFMSQNPQVAPAAFVQLLQHTRTLYDHVIFLSVQNDVLPYVDEGDRVQIEILFNRYHRVRIRYGFMETVDVPKVLTGCQLSEGEVIVMENSWFFMGKAIFLAGNHPEMSRWRMQLFLDMFRNAESATGFFNLPPIQVVDLGTRIVLDGPARIG